MTWNPQYFTCVCFSQTLSHLRISRIWTPQIGLFLYPGDEGGLGASESWGRRTQTPRCWEAAATPYPCSPDVLYLGPPTPPAGPRGWAGWTEMWAQASSRALTERAKVAVGLPHHVSVQSPLRRPQTPPLLVGEVHGHLSEAHGLGSPPLARGPL